jgi:fumarate reductase subunit C
MDPANSAPNGSAPRVLRTYVRPMTGWWQRNPFYRRYMLREATCVAVGVYAFELLVGVIRLSQGKGPFEGWMEAMASPIALVCNLVVLALVTFHAWTWFEVMPKTMPFVFVGGRNLPGRTIVTAGGLAAVVASLVLWILFWVSQP